MVKKEEAPPREVNAPFVQQDTMAPLEHMADGKTYDSKSAFRRATRETGCVEVGDARLSESKPQYTQHIPAERLVRAWQDATEMVKYDRHRE